MQLLYGNFSHDVGANNISIRTEVLRDGAERYIGYKSIWTIRGDLYASSQNSLISAIRTMELGYQFEGGNVILLAADGVTVAASILAANTHGGPRFSLLPSYPEDGRANAEWSTFRNYELVIEADTYTGQIVLIDWHETWATTGTGGPRFVYAEPLIGPVFVDQITQVSVCRAVQAGSAVGLVSWPVAPSPIFPGNENFAEREIVKRDPKRRGRPGFAAYKEFETTWKYTFTRALPFPNANPNAWPAAQ